jgi:hypothetical protein
LSQIVMANDTDQEQRKGWLPAFSGANKIFATISAALAIWSGWNTILTSRNTDKIATLSEQQKVLVDERDWVKQIFEKYDVIVSAKDEKLEDKIDRLTGLLALTDLVADSKQELKSRLAQTISDQAERYKVTLNATPSPSMPNSAVAAISAQLDTLQRLADSAVTASKSLPDATVNLQASAASTAASPRWSNYDFDIFWCPTTVDTDQAVRIANLVLALKNEDPNASGRWRVRTLSPDKGRSIATEGKGYVIRVGSDDEEKLATTLRDLAKQKGIPSPNGPDFKIVREPANTTPWYLSIYVCP